MLATLRRLAPMLLPVALAGALLTGCGGGDDNKSVTELLDRAFKSSIGSADMKLEIQVELDGVDELQDPIEVTLSGPYESGQNKQIPSVDWDITVRAQNQSFNAGLTSTGDRAFVGFQGTDYEVDPATVARLNQQIAAGSNRNGKRNLGDFGVTARDWVVDAKEEGNEQVAGVDTTHVSGKLDVARALDDLNTVVQQAAKLGGQTTQVPPELTDEQKQQVEDVVEDPSFDAYVDNDDKIRRLSADLQFDVPEDSRDRVGGLEGGRVSFSIEFANIGSPQPIKAPSDARPISELTQQLRSLLSGALGGATQGGVAPQDGGAAQPAPQTDAQKRKAYEDCVKSDPTNKQVRAFCQVLLQ